MKIDKKMIERAKIIEGKIKKVEWADDFLTVDEMLKAKISWKTIQQLLSEKYKKSFTINGLVRDFKKYYLSPKGRSGENLASNDPEKKVVVSGMGDS